MPVLNINLAGIVFLPKPTHYKFKDIEGVPFGRLTPLGIVERDSHPRLYWLCRCVCGNFIKVAGDSLTTGNTSSCGCLRVEMTSERFTTHNMSYSPEYKSFAQAKSRCQNPNDGSYFRYGDRGIKFRFESFDEFLTEVGRRPTPKHTIDRIDNDGHYEKGNVEWATRKEQARHRRTSHSITFNGETHVLAYWAEKLNIRQSAIIKRLKMGWTLEAALTTPSKRRKT